MHTKILICGDSFAVTDPCFPGLHWSEKIFDQSANYEVLNFACGGGTNSLIELQLHQGLKYNPDFVILAFTEPNRFEFDKNINLQPINFHGYQDVVNYNFERYTTSAWINNGPIYDIWTRFATLANSIEFGILKTYFTMSNIFTKLNIEKIPFCWTRGGVDLSVVDALTEKNHIVNHLGEFYQHRLTTDLWKHASYKKDAPYFHVPDPQVHSRFANECIFHINKTHQ